MSTTLTRLKDDTFYMESDNLADIDYFNIGSIPRKAKICITGNYCTGKTALAKYIVKKRNIRKWHTKNM